MGSSVLLRIRWCQVRKELNGAGLIYALLLLLIAFIVAVFLYTRFCNPTHTLVFTLLIMGSVLSLQLSRRDKAFVFQHFERPVRALYTEYLVLTFPFIISLLATPHWYAFLVMQAAFYGIAHIRATPARKTWLRGLSRLIPAQDFEWLAGMRKSGVMILFLYIAACSLSWLVAAPLAGLWLITMQVAAFYLEGEPLVLLWSNADTPVQLLQRKIRRHCFLLAVLSLPVLLLHTLLCPEMILINLVFLPAQMLLLVFAILLKYTTYSPGKLISGNNILLGLAALSIAIPFLLPVPVLMCIRNYGRALTRLKYYTYDPNS